MKFSNFKYFENRRNKATVDIETGFWFWKKSSNYKIFYDARVSGWVEVTTGKIFSTYEQYVINELADTIDLKLRLKEEYSL